MKRYRPATCGYCWYDSRSPSSFADSFWAESRLNGSLGVSRRRSQVEVVAVAGSPGWVTFSTGVVVV
jgi:hypothetical protein